MNNFAKRAVFGFIYVAVLLSGVLGGYWAFATVFALICLLSVYELSTLLEKQQQVDISAPVNIFGSLLLFFGIFIYVVAEAAYLLWLFPIWLIFVFVLQMYQQKHNPIMVVTSASFTWMYIALPLALSVYLVHDKDAKAFRSEYLLSLFILIWINDTFAYLTGMLLGKHRLFERISPKKSWEGFCGGLFFAVAFSFLLHYFYPSLSLLQWLVFAALVVISGTYGDLFESLLKRTMNVKDSGNMIPGHGGILDRFDSTLFAIPVVVVYLWLLDAFRV